MCIIIITTVLRTKTKMVRKFPKVRSGMSARAIRSRLKSEGNEGQHSPPVLDNPTAGEIRRNAFSFSSLNAEDVDFEGDGDQMANEVQLAALQEQLVAVMLDNQHLNDELKSLRETGMLEQLRQQLEREKEKSRILMDRLQEMEAKEKDHGEREARERERHPREKSLPPGDKSPRSPSRGRFVWKRRGLEKSKSLDQSEFLASLNGTSSGTGAGGGSTTPSSEWLDEDQRRESDSDDPDREKGLCDTGGQGSDSDQGPSGSNIISTVSPKDPLWRRMEVRIISFVRELMKDFSEVAEEEQPDGDPEGDPLTVKKLKENILRFGCVMRPLTDLSAVVKSLLHWESPSATLLALVVYLYCVIFGWVLTLVLVLAIIRLSVNYLKKRGWTQTVFRRLRREGGEPIENPASEAGLGDKFALVLQVARRVQNQLGAVSNAAEKCKNLLLWEHEATSRLYAFLWVVLLASVLLPSSQLFTLTGVYLGLKFFVMDFIFFRYPRIRQKYDSTSRLWDTLPTDADLERRGDKARNENGNSSPDLTSFLELFNLPATESPLPGWQSGRRCTLVNRDRSITSAFKNGRLYLTNRLAKQDKQTNSSTKLSASTNKASSSSSNKLIPAGNSKGSTSNKSPLLSTSKTYSESGKKSSLPGFSKSHSDTTSSASGFSFLNKGSKSSKAKDIKESKEEEELDLLASIFAYSDSSEPIDPSKIFQFCEKARETPKCSRSKDLESPEFRSPLGSDSQPDESRPLILTRRKKLLLRSVSELSETTPEISEDEEGKTYHSSPDIKRHNSDKDLPVRDREAKPKKSKLKLKTHKSLEHKPKPSVIDKLNERVFFAV